MSTNRCQPGKIKKVNNWLDIIQNYCFPPTCLFCGAAGKNSQDICPACKTALPLNPSRCRRCGSPFDFIPDRPAVCGNCLRQPPAFDATHAPFLYRGALRYSIHALKYQKQLKYARLLGFLLAESLTGTAPLPDAILPVPLHRKRYQERGFNQSLEIAKTLARCLNLNLDVHSCKRTRDTGHQTRLNPKQRHKNLRNAFAVSKPVNPAHIAIIDDVMTTGATVNELTITLKKAGAQRVDIWVCARALMRS